MIIVKRYEFLRSFFNLFNFQKQLPIFSLSRKLIIILELALGYEPREIEFMNWLCLNLNLNPNWNTLCYLVQILIYYLSYARVEVLYWLSCIIILNRPIKRVSFEKVENVIIKQTFNRSKINNLFFNQFLIILSLCIWFTTLLLSFSIISLTFISFSYFPLRLAT
jgi:hypothetical protein